MEHRRNDPLLELVARMWREDEDLEMVVEGDVVEVDAQIEGEEKNEVNLVKLSHVSTKQSKF